jgi:protein arginine kinase
MQFTDLINQPADWMKGSGLHSGIVMTSRVRLARNLRGYPFPGWSQERQRIEMMNQVRPVIAGLPVMQGGYVEDYASFSKIRKQVLVERHLISREHAARSNGCAVVIDEPQQLSIMINEEDHFRMQGIRPGLNLRLAYQSVNAVDSAIQQVLPYAYDEHLGYLTACPTNLGTGMRASVMLHLPGIVLAEQAQQVMRAVSKIGLAVRGLYGEGTEALGHLFQISNQHTLGEAEDQIISQIEEVIAGVLKAESNARMRLLEDQTTLLQDQIGRAFATLRYAHILNSKEALNFLSMVRLGADLDLIPGCDRSVLDLLLLEIQPAHLQMRAQRELSAEERDALRAEITRHRLQHLNGPSNVSLTQPSNASSEAPSQGEE